MEDCCMTAGISYGEVHVFFELSLGKISLRIRACGDTQEIVPSQCLKMQIFAQA